MSGTGGARINWSSGLEGKIIVTELYKLPDLEIQTALLPPSSNTQ